MPPNKTKTKKTTNQPTNPARNKVCSRRVPVIKGTLLEGTLQESTVPSGGYPTGGYSPGGHSRASSRRAPSKKVRPGKSTGATRKGTGATRKVTGATTKGTGATLCGSPCTPCGSHVRFPGVPSISYRIPIKCPIKLLLISYQMSYQNSVDFPSNSYQECTLQKEL